MDEIYAPAARFDRVGEEVGGRIVDVASVQQTEYKTRIPFYWENRTKVTRAVNPATGEANDPMMQRVVTVDVGVPDENGNTERRIFIRGKRMTSAYKDALAAGGAGRQGILIGGQLYATWTGTEASQGGGADAKTYRFRYVAPKPGEGTKPDAAPILAGQPGEFAVGVAMTGGYAAAVDVGGVTDRLTRAHADNPVTKPYMHPRQAATVPAFDDSDTPPF
jgi:hypothetical protein